MSELTFFGEQLAKELNPKAGEQVAAVQRGVMLYRQELVFDQTVTPDFVRATVQDVTPVKVELDLTFPLNSSCTCKRIGFCRHQLAVFFAAYAAVGSVSEWVQSWKEQSQGISDRNPLQLQRARDLLNRTKKQPLVKSYQAWIHFVDEAFAEFIIANKDVPSYVLPEKWRNYTQRLRAETPIEREWKVLYDFITSFRTFLLLADLLEQFRKSPAAFRYFHSLISDITDDLHSIIQQLSRQARPFAFDHFFEAIKGDTHRLMTVSSILEYESTDLYRAIWGFLLKNPKWRKEELGRLENFEAPNELPKQIAYIHLLLLNNRNSELPGLLRKLDVEACPYLFYWIKLEAESDLRATPFIEFLVQNIRPFLQQLGNYYECTDFVRTFSGPVNAFCVKNNRTDLLEKFYRQSLPYSYWSYATYLFEEEQYKKWVDLHVYAGISLDSIGTEAVKVITAADPSLVLPLYYHAVEQQIGLKNRSAYRQAVRYLKKMRTVYKKLKQEDVFTDYVGHIAESTKRLRAFQEELQRGKLIHA
ncbi:SWIM zinc finger family protein [Peribacillus saganii]|uniref:SWIM zinc finger family protein n=1 Tax=Peribacillus saganii TaxID=2303992 RepID=A0A372LMD1_9BACI|nr:SWIM zinc finger family protein [Peribacillus saganii]RFU67108.1 SWIM zinc finger family protein [Peribacillus saganii]